MLYDNHNRPINYLRLAVTDRCNLRCFYCMPEHGLQWLGRQELLTCEEMLRLCTLLTQMGIEKIRITGGEPFVRKDIMPFMTALSRLPGLRQINLTTNGVLTAPLVPELKKMGICSVNLSLDTLDRERFFQMTRRDELPSVLETLHQLLRHNIFVKINAVVMDGQNDQDIGPLADLTRELPVDVRFIEEMPFNGTDHDYAQLRWDHRAILERLRGQYPAIAKLPDPPFSTAYHYQVPGHQGKLGIIAAYSRTFCGTCNRIRITPTGVLKTCLYDHGVLSLRDMLRNGATDAHIAAELLRTFGQRHRDGRAAELARAGAPVQESMATIGG